MRAILVEHEGPEGDSQKTDAAQDGSKREAVEVIADTVQFLGSRGDSEGGGQRGGFQQTAELKPDPVPAFGGGAEGDDDIPF